MEQKGEEGTLRDFGTAEIVREMRLQIIRWSEITEHSTILLSLQGFGQKDLGTTVCKGDGLAGLKMICVSCEVFF